MFLKKSVVWALCFALFISTSPRAASQQNASTQGQATQKQAQGQPQDANLSAKELDNLVSPIALYPDALVAQVLAAATYPDQLTAASEWLKSNSSLKDQALMEAADKQSWDPSVKALTQFPSVLDNMAANLSWTSALGEASYYQQKDVVAAIQRLRKEAKSAGNLKSGEQIKVVQQDPQTIVIEPANPQVVYVPQYNPTVVYGVPYSPPGYSSADLALTGILSFGVGMAVGAAMSGGCCGWGYSGWGMGWHGGTVNYQRNVYVSRSGVYGGGYNRGAGYYGGTRSANYNRGNVGSGNVNSGNRQTNIGSVNVNTGGNANVNRTNANTRPATTTSSREAWKNSGGQGGARATTAADRGYGQRAAPSTNSGAFSGYNKGGNVRSEASRGQSSFSGGGGGGARSRPSGGGGRRR